MLESIGWATYLFYAAWNVVAFFVVWKWFVETKGKTLEEIDAVFNDGAAAVDINKSFDYHQTQQMGEEKPTTFNASVSDEEQDAALKNKKEQA